MRSGAVVVGRLSRLAHGVPTVARCVRTACVLVAVSATTVAAQSSNGAAAESGSLVRDTGAHARVAVVVTDALTGGPISAHLQMAGRSAQRTDSLGRLSFTVESPGALTLRVLALGYEARAVPLDVSAGDSLVLLAVRLTAITRTLSPVHTRAQSVEREAFDRGALGSMVVLRSQDLTNVPAVGERDVLRTLALLPGVAARSDFTSSFSVRGGEADQNLVLLDGIPIYNPFHLGGMFGTFIDAAVGEIALSTGGFPARHGGRLSSVLEVTSAHETRNGVHGSTDLSMLATASRVAGSHANGRVAWSLAGRRTYLDKVLQVVRGADVFPYHFRDAQGSVRVLTPGGGVLSATAYSGHDILDATQGGAGLNEFFEGNALAFDWGNRVAGLTYTQPFGRNSSVVQQLSQSAFRTAFAVPADSLTFSQELLERRVSGRLEHAIATHGITVGYEIAATRSRYHEQMPPVRNPAFPAATASSGDTMLAQRGTTGAVFVDDVWRVTDRLTLRPGVRLEHVGNLGWQAASPRFAAKLRVTSDLAFTASAGRFLQSTHAVRNEDLPLRLFDFWMVADSTVPVSSATHFVVGAEHWLSPSQFVRVESYRKNFDRLIEPASTIDPRIRPSLLQRYQGAAYGIDVYVRQLTYGGFGGWLSYSYATSVREREGLRYYAAHDRRHSGDVVMTYAPDDDWTFGFHAGAATGSPYTGWAGHMQRRVFDPVAKAWAPGTSPHGLDVVHGARNAERLPLYARVDASIERRFEMEWATLRPMVSVVNVLDRRNVMMYALDDSGSPSRVTSIAQLPFVPSIGMRMDF